MVTITAADLHALQTRPGRPDELPGAVSTLQIQAGELGRLHKAADPEAEPGLPVAAGLAVRAADSGRILMLQRAADPVTCPCGMKLAWGMDGGDWWSHADGSISHDSPYAEASVSELVGTEPPDPAAGRWEFPGGKLEPGERPLEAGIREWQEETGCELPPGQVTGSWDATNGNYTGYVYEVASEADVPIFDGRDDVINPDDPDGDATEALAWFDPGHLTGNPAVRDELAADLPLVLEALAAEPDTAKSATDGVPGLTKRSGMISLDLPTGTITPVPGGPSEHHITLVYLGPDIDDDALATACDRAQAAAATLAGPLSGSVGGRDTFAPSAGSDGTIPVYANVELPGIHALRAHLADLSASEHAGYHPHVTLAYLDDGDPLPDPVPYTPVTFTHIAVHRGPQILTYPLGPATAAAPWSGKQANQAPKAASRAHVSWPGWGPDQAAADYWTPRLEAAFHTALGRREAEQLARDYAASGLGARGGRTNAELTTAALAWLTTRRLDLTGKLRQTLAKIHADGRHIGTASATALLDHTDPGLDNWQPGRPDTADRNGEETGDADEQAFGTDLDARTDQIATTHLHRIARALAIGVAAGLAASAIGATIFNAGAASARGITATELFYAIARAALVLYRRRNVEYGRWIASPGSCQTCRDNQAAGTLPLGAIYPGGLPAPPQHPNCGCALAPTDAPQS